MHLCPIIYVLVICGLEVWCVRPQLNSQICIFVGQEINTLSNALAPCRSKRLPAALSFWTFSCAPVRRKPSMPSTRTRIRKPLGSQCVIFSHVVSNCGLLFLCMVCSIVFFTPSCQASWIVNSRFKIHYISSMSLWTLSSWDSQIVNFQLSPSLPDLIKSI